MRNLRFLVEKLLYEVESTCSPLISDLFFHGVVLQVQLNYVYISFCLFFSLAISTFVNRGAILNRDPYFII